MTITLTTRVIRFSEAQTARVDDDLVILNFATSNYVALDNIGRRIWELLELPLQVDELCIQMTQEFRGDPKQIQSDVLVFLNELEDEKLVLVVDEPA